MTSATSPGRQQPGRRQPGRQQDVHGRPRHTTQQGFAHDIRHESATILMLAAALDSIEHLPVQARQLTALLMSETRRLDDLVAASAGTSAEPTGRPTPLRLDTLIRAVAEPVRLSTGVVVEIAAPAVTIAQDHLAVWRALRNILDNAVDATGPAGRIRVRLTVEGDLAIVDVDDDGPGLAAAPPRVGALGRPIVDGLARRWGGWFATGDSELGGCRATLAIPLTRDAATVG